MARRVAYLDSSAYVKALLGEAGEAALLTELANWDGYVSSVLLAVESIRSCARRDAGDALEPRIWLEGVSLVPIDDPILDKATELHPPVCEAWMRFTWRRP